MTDKRNPTVPSLPVATYGLAIAGAVGWLGDRYLLAKPVNAAPSRESHYHYPHFTGLRT